MSSPDPKFEQLLEYVRDERGFDYTGYRRPTLMRRFEKRMQTASGEAEADGRVRIQQGDHLSRSCSTPS